MSLSLFLPPFSWASFPIAPMKSITRWHQQLDRSLCICVFLVVSSVKVAISLSCSPQLSLSPPIPRIPAFSVTIYVSNDPVGSLLYFHFILFISLMVAILAPVNWSLCWLLGPLSLIIASSHFIHLEACPSSFSRLTDHWSYIPCHRIHSTSIIDLVNGEKENFLSCSCHVLMALDSEATVESDRLFLPKFCFFFWDKDHRAHRRRRPIWSSLIHWQWPY